MITGSILDILYVMENNPSLQLNPLMGVRFFPPFYSIWCWLSSLHLMLQWRTSSRRANVKKEGRCCAEKGYILHVCTCYLRSPLSNSESFTCIPSYPELSFTVSNHFVYLNFIQTSYLYLSVLVS